MNWLHRRTVGRVSADSSITKTVGIDDWDTAVGATNILAKSCPTCGNLVLL